MPNVHFFAFFIRSQCVIRIFCLLLPQYLPAYGRKETFLLDAFGLIYRAYYALISSPRFSSDGFNTSAVFGFCNTLDELLRKENPAYIGVCFDPPGGHTFRNELYPEYKAQRQKQPEDITLSIPIIKDILRAYRIPVIEMEGFEADDVIGSLAKEPKPTDSQPT